MSLIRFAHTAYFVSQFSFKKCLSLYTTALLWKANCAKSASSVVLYLLFVYDDMKRVNTSHWFVVRSKNSLSGYYTSFKSSLWQLYGSSWKSFVWYDFRSRLRGFKAKIKLIGLRYRILGVKVTQRCAWVTMGFSHFILIDLQHSLATIRRYKKRKYTLSMRSIDYISFFQFLFLTRRFRGPNVFTGNGVRLYGDKLVFKPRLRMK